MEKAGPLLGPVLRRLGIEAGVSLARIKNDWHRIFDKTLSAHMYPSQFSEGELLLNVDSPIWIQQLGFYKKEIVLKLGAYGVREVRFRIGRVGRTEQVKEAAPAPAELTAEEKEFVEGLLETIGDEGLRGAVKAAAEKSLRMKKERHTRSLPRS